MMNPQILITRLCSSLGSMKRFSVFQLIVLVFQPTTLLFGSLSPSVSFSQQEAVFSEKAFKNLAVRDQPRTKQQIDSDELVSIMSQIFPSRVGEDQKRS